jgi:predicted alpha/beta superfamily hydrolase
MSGSDQILYPAERERETAPVFLLLGEEKADRVLDCLRELTDAPFSLAACPVEDWDRELSPWPAKAVFKGGEDFGGGGDAFLERAEQAILPAVREGLGAPAAPVYLAGYSLAGLLAAYALFRLPWLTGAVCCSGSLWFPGFIEYAEAHPLAGKPERVYLSLGDKEKKSRNPVLSRVEDCTTAFRDLLLSRGINSTFVSNPGNHFQEPDRRMALGITWCLDRERETV